jgi:hypothetical protein
MMPFSIKFTFGDVLEGFFVKKSLVISFGRLTLMLLYGMAVFAEFIQKISGNTSTKKASIG